MEEPAMPEADYRYFVTYSGVKLPLRLVNQIQPLELENRNTYIRAQFDDQDRLVAVEKLVYGEVELAHRYEYQPDGALKAAHITMDGETTVMDFAGSAR
jgi:hypothetical protein